jgi:predicted ATPase
MGLTLLHRVYRRDYQEVFDRAGELMAFTEQHGLADHGSAGPIFRGWVLAMQGDPGAGLKMLEEGLARQHEIATNEDYPVYLSLLAEVLIALGRPEEARERIAHDRPEFERTGLRIWVPEMLRILGEAMIAADPDAVAETRQVFYEAAQLAKAQGAVMLALRVAVSEALLDRRLGALEQAAKRISSALRRVPEDDDSADLTEARRLCFEIGCRIGASGRGVAAEKGC